MKYISFRAGLFLGLTLAGLLILLFLPEPGGSAMQALLRRKGLLLVVVGLFLLAGYVFLIKPYRVLAGQSRRFTEGYLSLAELLESPVMYSPSSEKTLRHLEKLVGMTDAIDLSGHTLYVNGEASTEGTASEGEAVEMTVSEGGGSDTGMGMPGDGQTGEQPDGTPPELPDGATPGEPPAGAPGSSQN